MEILGRSKRKRSQTSNLFSVLPNGFMSLGSLSHQTTNRTTSISANTDRPSDYYCLCDRLQLHLRSSSSPEPHISPQVISRKYIHPHPTILFPRLRDQTKRIDRVSVYFTSALRSLPAAFLRIVKCRVRSPSARGAILMPVPNPHFGCSAQAVFKSKSILVDIPISPEEGRVPRIFVVHCNSAVHIFSGTDTPLIT